MATESIQVSGVINATPDRIYSAWLDSTEHSLFTGGKASVEPGIGGRFTAWDGYIQGTNLELEEGHRILQAWRSTEFPAGSGDSRLEVLLEPVEGGTRIMLIHTEIPEGMAGNLEQGWREHYLSPMAKYFGAPEAAEDEDLDDMEEEAPVVVKKAPAPKAAAKKKAKPRKAPKRKAKAKKKAARPKKKSAKKAARKAPKRKSAKGRGSKRRTRRR